MIQTTEKRVRVFHSVEVCTGVFGVAQYQIPSLGLYIHIFIIHQSMLYELLSNLIGSLLLYYDFISH